MRDGRRDPLQFDRWGAAFAAACAGWILTTPAFAQTTPAAAAAATETAPSERAQRDADKVFHWIMIQGDRTRKTAKDAPPPAKDEKAVAAPRPVRVVKLPAEGGAPAVPAGRPAEAPAGGMLAVNDPKPAAPSASTAAAGIGGPVQAASSVSTAADAAPVPGPVPTAPKVELAEPPAAMPANIGAAPADPDPVDVPLVPVAQSAPQFPLNLMRTLRKGSVQVRFTVQADGSVAEPEVLSTTNVRLNAAAMAAIGQWRFQPISRAQTGAVELGFNLD